MSGAITVFGDDAIVGWARLEDDPTYEPIVHLVQGDVIVASVIADEDRGDDNVHKGVRDHHFRFELSAFPDLSKTSCRIVVGESGEVLGGAAIEHGLTTVAEAKTFRDALASGLEPSDIVDGFFLDYLRRPADGYALAQFSAKASAEPAAAIVGWRRSILQSDEYKKRRANVADGVGQIFASPILPRTSRPVRTFETCLPAFLASRAPLKERLIAFFPGLLLIDGAIAQIVRMVECGLPDREAFFRALSVLADRPALLLDPRAIMPPTGSGQKRGNYEDGEPGVLPCGSRAFLVGWHEAEIDGGIRHRWMAQIGVVSGLNVDRPLARVEFEIDGAFGDVGRLMAASESEALRANLTVGDVGMILTITAAAGSSFSAERIVLLAEHARCPWRETGEPDPRLLSIRIRAARFFMADAA